jgi:acyl-coenzyme A thioesterase PaaI-like protein
MSRTKQANSRNCFVCGLENPAGLHLHIFDVGPGTVETTFTAPENLQGYPGVLHGGIVGALIDEVSGRAQMGSDPLKPRFMFTARMEVKYRQTIPIGKPLRIVGKALRSRDRWAEAWAGVYDAATDALLAEGTTMLVDVPRETLSPAILSELGWKVYPE